MTERKSYSSNKFQLELPYLIEVQKTSYGQFLQANVPAQARLKVGLERVFQDIFPIMDMKELFALKYDGYFFGIPKYGIQECRERGLTYSVPLHANLSLQVFEEDGEDRKLREEIKNDVLICDLPIMTENGTFIINGAERVVVSQLHRSPGVSFDEELLPNGRSDFKSRIIPHRGAWVEFTTDGDILYLIIDRKKKIPATALLRCIGFDTMESILNLFYKKKETLDIDFNDVEKYKGRIVFSDIIDQDSGEIILEANAVLDDKKLERLSESGIKTVTVIAEDEENFLMHNTLSADKCRSREDALKLIYQVTHQSQEEAPNVSTAEIFFENLFLRDTRKYDLGEVGRYRLNAKVYTPGVEKLLAEKGLSKPSLTTMTMTEADFLSIIDYMVGLYNSEDGYALDDIDHLGNRRTRSVGELLSNQLSVGLSRMSRVIRENLSLRESEGLTPRDLVNTRTVNSVVQAFFGSSQLSQFMDQMNPLSELTHKRRLSALGPGGLSRERAGFEVRDVHYTHYGRLCPIETPEGPNIGLINSLATYGVINHFGFIETPFRVVGLLEFKDASGNAIFFPEEKWHFGIFKSFVREPRLFILLELSDKEMDDVRYKLDNRQRDLFDSFCNKVFEFKKAGSSVFVCNGTVLEKFSGKPDYVQTSNKINQKVSSFITYLTADEQDAFCVAPASTFCVAPASTLLDESNAFAEDFVLAQLRGEFTQFATNVELSSDDEGAERVDLMDVAPMQIVSIAAGLIPFLEHDDANRALMGSNMMRQAVPLLRTEAPIVGTGLEGQLIKDSRTQITAENSGEVVYVDADRIDIQYDRSEAEEFVSFETSVKSYAIPKFRKTNQNTTVDLRPICRKGDRVVAGQILTEGYSTQNGELAIGKNLKVAFMPWKGYNFEDAIVINERVVREDIFTSVHVDEYILEVRETKRGIEELTSDIPNVSEDATKDLDENGIIRVGARVEPGDILIGKITPKGESDPSPEEKLLRAIFGDKAGDVKDASLKASPSLSGVVIGTSLFSKAVKKRKSRLADKAILPKIDEAFEKKMDKLKNVLVQKLLVLTEGKISQGVKDFMNMELIPKGIKFTQSELYKLDYNSVQVSKWTNDDEKNQMIQSVIVNYLKKYKELDSELRRQKFDVTIGDELPTGIVQMAKVYIAKKRKLQVGDKMAGRHGNKGIVSRIVRQEDMPFLEDGTPVDIVLNPLGVPSRMNLGQIFETVLGWAGKNLGVKFATPIFDGASLEDLNEWTDKADVPRYGKTYLYDGGTGERFDQPATVGIIYMLKLGHMVDDKMHARSIGPYSLITQQPLGGKAQFGGQRFGEMEVWALEAFGASYILQEILTIKSDDVVGRSKAYEAIVKGDPMPIAGIPESLNVLLHEMKGLGLSVTLE